MRKQEEKQFRRRCVSSETIHSTEQTYHKFEILLKRGVKITALNVLRLLDDAQHSGVSPPTRSALTELAFEEASKANELIEILRFTRTYIQAVRRNVEIEPKEDCDEIIDPVVDFENYFNKHLRIHQFKLQGMLKLVGGVFETLTERFAPSGCVDNLRSLGGLKRVLVYPKLTDVKDSGFYVDFRDMKFKNVKPSKKRLVDELTLLSSITAFGAFVIIGDKVNQERAIDRMLKCNSTILGEELSEEKEKPFRQLIANIVIAETQKFR